jgi:hypothetical protein
MTFATDRDLLMLEPHLFRDVAFGAQRLLHSTDASVSGTTLHVPDVDLTARGVGVGNVALADGRGLEIVALVDAHAVTASLLRPSTDDAAIPPGDGAVSDLRIVTFRPQLQLAHDEVIDVIAARAGMDTSDVPSQLVNADAFRLIAAYAALVRIYDAAGDDDHRLFAARAQRCDLMRDALLRRAEARLDLDGDGRAERFVRFDRIRLTRA